MINVYETDNKSIDDYLQYVPNNLVRKAGFMIDIVVYAVEEEDIPIGAVTVKYSGDECIIKSCKLENEYDNFRIFIEVISNLTYIAKEHRCKAIKAGVIPKQSVNLHRALCSFNNKKRLEEVGYLEFVLKDVINVKRLQVPAKATFPLSHTYAKEMKEFFMLPQNIYAEVDFDINAYDCDVSSVYFEDKKPAAVLLIKKAGEDGLWINRLISLAKDKTALLYLMAFSVREAAKKYGCETVVKTVVANERLTPILEIVLEKEIERREEIIINLDFVGNIKE